MLPMGRDARWTSMAVLRLRPSSWPFDTIESDGGGLCGRNHFSVLFRGNLISIPAHNNRVGLRWVRTRERPRRRSSRCEILEAMSHVTKE
ncbi:hypothetical protein EVAR_89051_1 [Eumeta japonica]|uniref:Uncharacterized protein n=1 Tax=Eumeta variegata TaxID=151549 RepID=A0A4C1XH42_EUMVA|nr:hypothetical protein EVAR_89051_1 [Eumeta japonica]